MEGLSFKKYMHTSRKRFDPTALIISLVGLAAVIGAVASYKHTDYYDLRSLLIVVGGTFACVLFQFDFGSTFRCILLVLKSFLGTPEKKILTVLRQLDEAIINQSKLSELREGSAANGEILNDVVYMHSQGLVFEEIDEFVTSRIADEFLERRVAVDLLRRAAVISPALGLFGTVMGLIGVLKTLSDPSQIGPSMSLALMTTAYGAGLGSLFFTPLAGRLEHHNTIYLEAHQQFLSKVGTLLWSVETTNPSLGGFNETIDLAVQKVSVF